MNANRIRIVKDDIDKFVNIPINMQWDFMGRDDSISEYEVDVLKQVTGAPADFEIARFAHNIFPNTESAINYEFNFYDYLQPITANTVPLTAWTNSYLNNGFSVQDVYYFSKPFTKSFFKLDFYDTTEERTQQIYLSVILPTQQGLTQTAILSNLVPLVEIKRPFMSLDYIGSDKEGFFIYWLRNRDFIDISTFYMTAKFFDARQGVFKQMTNTRQDLITPSKFQFNNADYFYYKVDMNYTNKTYEVFSTSTTLRVGDLNSPIKWYEYVNP
jgi:hypothetical protein